MRSFGVLRRIVYYLLGILEVLLAFRLVFKLLGANPANGFVSVIYTVSGVFLVPFSGIFKTAVNNGIETKSIVEPSTIIAMIVYALIAYGIVMLIKIFIIPKSGKQLQSEKNSGSKSTITKVETTTNGTQLQGKGNAGNKSIVTKVETTTDDT
jgi:hypothetical protein